MLEALLRESRALAHELAMRPNLGLNAAPRRELERLAALGLMMAPFPVAAGGLGLGIDAGTHLPLLKLLTIVGGADLALGRIYEGHVNGVLLVARYGSAEQVARLADECRAGMISGVWNTGGPQVLRIEAVQGRLRFEGIKTFATGAAFVQRPIVTAELEGQGWQMTLPKMDTLGAALDRSFWHPLGMESSESFQVDFSGGALQQEELIGAPGDFYRDPMFRGGAIRFAAVQTGALVRLHGLFTAWLKEVGREGDPYQIARLGEISILTQEAVLWVERAALVAEQSFYREEKQHRERMIECANRMRIAIERKATRVMELVTTGVGAHGLLQPHPFERILRDLTMYLRQPAPDQALAATGRASLDKSGRYADGTEWGLWASDPATESLQPKYFQKIYQLKRDPWDFESSAYERDKYARTIQSLPRGMYDNAVEVGCSIGVLTACLAVHCRRLLGIDVSDQALTLAARRCAALPQVRFARMQVPEELPNEQFDLVVLSEVAYYWSMTDLHRVADAFAKRHRAGGHLVLVHLTEPVADYPLTGDDVHGYWLTRPEWKSMHSSRHERFRIDVLQRHEV
ncbi:SAM-dependent methyltransferase [Granulicella rosea]|nr:SAM-dependent methyltransferase [Granulicella rosea]